MIFIRPNIDWDPSSWNMGPELTQRRRNLFWELYSLDNWKVRCENVADHAFYILTCVIGNLSLWAPEDPHISELMRLIASFRMTQRK